MTERELKALLDRARISYARMSPEQKTAHDKAQRESFIRAMTARCEHGRLDFEQCGECRGATK